MEEKNLVFNENARTKLIEGINLLADAVKTTLGPCGKTVIINEPDGPHITKDGVSVAEAVNITDKDRAVGAALLKKVASKTCKDAGDGTTTATIIAQSFINQGNKILKEGGDLRIITQQTLELKDKIFELLNDVKTFINLDDTDRLKQIATLSANGDPEVGTIITKVLQAVGVNSTVSIEEGKKRDTTYEIVPGMQFERGYLSKHFINTNKGYIEMDKALVLIYDGKITAIQDIANILGKVLQTDQNILLMADDFSTDVVDALITNKYDNKLKVCAIKAPGFSEGRRELIQDIAVLVGTKVFDRHTSLDTLELSDLGAIKNVKVKRETTTLLQDDSTKESVNKFIANLKKELSNETDDFRQSRLKERIAKLFGGVAIINVGAISEIEMKEKKDRYDDALCATLAALEDGIVPGGGVTLFVIANFLSSLYFTDIQKALLRSLKMPLTQIAYNSNMPKKVFDTLCTKLSSLDMQDFGNHKVVYDFRQQNWVNSEQEGISDPAKVTKSALENAISIALMILSTQCIVHTTTEDSYF